MRRNKEKSSSRTASLRELTPPLLALYGDRLANLRQGFVRTFGFCAHLVSAHYLVYAHHLVYLPLKKYLGSRKDYFSIISRNLLALRKYYLFPKY
jgi:hypothetical protein